MLSSGCRSREARYRLASLLVTHVYDKVQTPIPIDTMNTIYEHYIRPQQAMIQEVD